MGKRYGILVLLTFFLLVSCQHQDEEIRILFIGDILLSRQVKKEYDYRKVSPWENLKPLFLNSDLVIGNLEGSVGTISDTVTSSLLFAIDSADISLLSDAGFNLIGIENNHSYDLGIEGRQNTINKLLKNNIHPVGFEHSPYFISVKGVVLSIVTINTIAGNNCPQNPMYSIELRQKMALAKSLSNMVIVSIHWGNELLDWSNKTQQEAAKWLIAEGADIIIGSHPHVIQKPEIIDGKPVFFSLGNHLFDQKYPATKKGLMVEITAKNGKYKCKGITTNTEENSFYPKTDTFVSFNFPAFEYNRKLFCINGLSLIPVSVFEQTQTKVILQAYQDKHLMWRSHPMPLIYIVDTELDGKEIYLFTLQNYYSTLDKEISLRPYVYMTDFHGIYPKWRGSALAYPLLDAQISPYNSQVLCALHRGDTYIVLDKENSTPHMMAYQWNGFGFSGLPDSVACKYCMEIYGEILNK